MTREALRSPLYDDIYFSTEDGIGESKAVFLDGIGAPEVWQGVDKFTICELGLGTGLNFLNSVKLWLETTGENQTLEYLATEKHPLSGDIIKAALEWPELDDYKKIFLAHYPRETFSLFDGRISFRMLVGDSCEQLRGIDTKINAWYLDGFAPSKNPDMWSRELFSELARHSTDRARLATFTAAGFVRRGLSEAGFEMIKRIGYGKKREMLSGIFKAID